MLVKARVQGQCRRRAIFGGALALGVAVGIVEVGVVLLQRVVGHGGAERRWTGRMGREERADEENNAASSRRQELIKVPVDSRRRNRDTNGALLGGLAVLV